MNTLGRFASTATLRFSTDQTALNVNRFIAARPALMGRPEASAQPSGTSAAPVPLQVLYPSLYAERSSLVQRWGDSLRAIAIIAGSPFAAARKPIS